MQRDTGEYAEQPTPDEPTPDKQTPDESTPDESTPDESTPEARTGPDTAAEQAQVVPSDWVRQMQRGYAGDDIDPLLLPDADPDATARMTAQDFAEAGFDPADTLGPQPPTRSLDVAGCALAVRVEPGRTDVCLISQRGELVSAQTIPSSPAGHPAPGGDTAGTVGGAGTVSAAATIRLAGTADDADAELAAETEFAAIVAAIDEVVHAAGLDPDVDQLPGIGVVLTGGSDGSRAKPWFRTFPLQDRLFDKYGVEVRVLTAATAIGIGEHWRGAARGRRNLLSLHLDHGIDGAVLIDNRLVRGTTGNAGHIGHVCVDPYGPPCACGARGCLQAIAGGAAITGWAAGHGGGSPTDATEVAESARAGDPISAATLRRAGEAIGQAVAGVVTLLDLDVVVISGPLIGVGPVLFDPINDGYGRYATLGYAAPPRIVPALLGREGVLLGAAAAVLHPDSYPTS